MHCEKCGSEIKAGNKFCESCGSKPEASKDGKSSKFKPILIGLVALLVIGGVFAYFGVLKPKGDSTKPVCNSSYSLVNSECCLDRNANSICDKDEQTSLDVSKSSEVKEFCGDNKCAPTETKCSCPQDCGTCAGSAGICSQYNCDGNTCNKKTLENCCGNKKCEQGETNFECPDDCTETDLSSFPYLINARNDVSYVVGDQAESTSIQLTANLIPSLTPSYGESMLLVSELSKSKHANIILIGTTCDNEKIAELLNINKQQCTVSFDKGVGVVKLIKNPDKTYLILTGNDYQGVYRAVTVLADYKGFQLKGNEIHITTGINGKIGLQYIE